MILTQYRPETAVNWKFAFLIIKLKVILWWIREINNIQYTAYTLKIYLNKYWKPYIIIILLLLIMRISVSLQVWVYFKKNMLGEDI